MESPIKIAKKVPNAINGPKGIGSFLSFLLDQRRNIEITAPIIKDINIIKKESLKPKNSPETKIISTSPQPMPLVNNIITVIIRAGNTAPKR